ncbi:thioredoxin family protein [Carnobacterium maltaromaticum]|jgi:thioredoxin 1|uniref:thioredoxin family protein n=1 Tax=Carnobacterium maltaromaticum TaxID=2751 RepID=UPI000E72CEAB|nr:thioredoxin family protein [Carnobacterium maltaromaticum]AOA02561.1 thiol reductase thioredoxin [Carnobacterium maltaromaticum]MCI1819540.1 thioredoxin family protein [Carnobacterium maltaromaticum]
MITNLTQDNFQTEISNGLTLVDFWGEWCSSCQRLSAVLTSVAPLFSDDQIKMAKLNVNQNKQIAEAYQIMSIPTMVLFKNGEPIEKITGYLPREVLIDYLNNRTSQPSD